MARYKGIIPISGKVGDFIFTQRKRKTSVKEKSKKPIQLSEGSKKSGADFKRANELIKRIRQAFGPMIADYGDSEVIQRMQKAMMGVFNAIPKEQLGQKQAADGDLKLLQDLQFNPVTSLTTLLWQKPVVTIDVTSGIMVNFEAADINKLVKHEPRAVSVAFDVILGAFNLDSGKDEMIQGKKLTVQLDHAFKGARLKVPLEFAGRQLVIVGIGLHYLDSYSAIMNQKERAAAFIWVELLHDGEVVRFTPRRPDIKENVEEEGIDWEVG